MVDVQHVPIEISDVTSPVDEAELRDALIEFNCQATGYRDGRSLSCFLRNDDGTLIAGIDGFTWGGYARIDYLWVSDTCRRANLGSRLLAAAEEEARARGCTTVVLDTHSFQAPGFYRRRHYLEVGLTQDTPRGHTQVLFQKTL
jgi:ribosomal protein S18 acetylase RimI-like enzyme